MLVHYTGMFPRITFVKRSGNSKIGKIPASISPQSTCPDVCPLKAGVCYAKYGPMAMHWKNVDKNGYEFVDFLAEVRKLPANQLWRHNTAGDLAGTNNDLDNLALGMLVEANRGRRGFTYTHKPMTQANRRAVSAANLNGFTVNVSLNSLAEVDAFGLGVLPIAVVLPERSESFKPRAFVTEGGNQVVVCPAQWRDTSCEQCGMCQRAERSYAIGFHKHGAGKKKDQLVQLRRSA